MGGESTCGPNRFRAITCPVSSAPSFPGLSTCCRAVMPLHFPSKPAQALGALWLKAAGQSLLACAAPQACICLHTVLQPLLHATARLYGLQHIFHCHCCPCSHSCCALQPRVSVARGWPGDLPNHVEKQTEVHVDLRGGAGRSHAMSVGPETPPNGANHPRGPTPAAAHSTPLDWNLHPLKVELPPSNFGPLGS
jgi:hypothetical protein